MYDVETYEALYNAKWNEAEKLKMRIAFLQGFCRMSDETLEEYMKKL
tara:strand:- start:191 stop:331 length:141 start_codon:yes stop_codon:yes gene_type:complete